MGVMFKENLVPFWKILGVGLLIPIVTPLIFTLYLSYMPGDRVGSVDGWLGYLGGYSGGFLAFLSAYFIYRQDQLARNRTVLNVRTCPTSKEEIQSAKYHAYYTQGDTKNLKLERDSGRVVGVDDYPVIKTKIKNISQNYASAINLILIISGKEIIPLIYTQGSDLFSKFDSMAELESSEEFEFILHIDPHIWGDSNTLEFSLRSNNLSEDTNNQRLVLHKGSKGGVTFEAKT